ncbi:MAG: SoxR reducing system RseC family protein [Chlamydiae bacterium]|nr:SoxR reducing system RseC family protein [Chlamydiota bacterium]
MNNDKGLFSNLQALNKAALFLFLLAKIFGLLGISFGFAGGEYLRFGGGFLGLSLVFIFSAITCGLFQTAKDREQFCIEDEAQVNLKKLSNEKVKLEKEIKDLEARKLAVHQFLMNRSFNK